MQSWCPSLPKWVCESTVCGSSACMITYSIALQGREGGVRAALLEVAAAPRDGISVNVSYTWFHNDFTTSPLVLMVDWMENIVSRLLHAMTVMTSLVWTWLNYQGTTSACRLPTCVPCPTNIGPKSENDGKWLNSQRHPRPACNARHQMYSNVAIHHDMLTNFIKFLSQCGHLQHARVL